MAFVWTKMYAVYVMLATQLWRSECFYSPIINHLIRIDFATQKMRWCMFVDGWKRILRMGGLNIGFKLSVKCLRSRLVCVCHAICILYVPIYIINTSQFLSVGRRWRVELINENLYVRLICVKYTLWALYQRSKSYTSDSLSDDEISIILDLCFGLNIKGMVPAGRH